MKAEQRKPARPSARHRMEYGLARTLEAAVSTLPEGAADAVGRRLGATAYRLGIRRSVVEANLRLAFPDADPAWRDQVARGRSEERRVGKGCRLRWGRAR